MIVEHIQGIFSPEHGGPMISLRNFAQGQSRKGLTVRVRVLEGFPDCSPALRLRAEIDQKIFQVGFPRVAGRSAALKRFLGTEEKPDIFHIHGAWHLAQKYGADEARRRGVPYTVEMMGSYQPEELSRKPWRKWLFRRAFQDQILRQAACIHANSIREAQQLRDLGFRGAFAIIPVGFDVETADALESGLADHTPPFANAPGLADQRYVLFLARVHKNKGVEVLLEAWSRLARDHANVALVIAGPSAVGYQAELAARYAPLVGSKKVIFLGYVDDWAKIWLYRHAAVYCLPSYSENFGATIQDALGYGTPVITTRNTPWHNLEALGMGWLADTEAKSLASHLHTALSLPTGVTEAMGAKARIWIRKEFALSAVIDEQIKLYQWLSGGEKPGFVISD